MLLRNFLTVISGWMAFIIYVRFFISYFHERHEELQMFGAIMATCVPILEKMGDSKIQTPEAYIWTKSFIGAIKGMLMVSVFVVNGLANDFYISWFFYTTTSIGMVFFFLCPYISPIE